MKVIAELKRFRIQKIRNDLTTAVWVLAIVLMVSLMAMLSAETLFWLSPAIRYGAWWVWLITLILAVTGTVVTLALIKKGRITRYRPETCAAEVGEATFPRKDDVLNAVQLEQSIESDSNYSKELTDQFLQQIKSKLSILAPKIVLLNDGAGRPRGIALITLILAVVVTLTFLPEFIVATRHWLNPQSSYSPPHPFRILSNSGDIYLMGGDSASVVFTVEGEVPDSLSFEMKELESKSVTTLIPDEKDIFRHEIDPIFQNLEYRAFVKAEHFWERWGEISSPVHTIEVIDRPTIKKFSVTVQPPTYSGLERTIQEGNVAEIRGLVGSHVTVNLSSDKNLTGGYLTSFNADSKKEEKIGLTIQRNQASGSFTMAKEVFITSHIFDKRNIKNLNPIKYRVLPIPDAFPSIEVLMPSEITELGSDFSVPVQLHIQDDFGFSNLQIVYETKHPDYVGSRDLVSVQTIPTLSNVVTSQDVFYIWNLSFLELMPEDEVKFHFESYDNDLVSGPKKSLSQEFIARFPSLADLFARMEQGEDLLEEDLGDMLRDLEEINDAVEDIELRLLKTEELEWEDRQTLQQSVEEMRNKLEEVKALQDAVNQIREQAEKHELFSSNLMEKFKNLNELLQDIVTPEMLESMIGLDDAMESLSTDELMKALRDFQGNSAAMEAQIDRFIEIFKRIRAEQKMNELVTRFDHLTEQQEKLASEVATETDDENSGRLSTQQERNREEYERLKNLMKETADAMESFAIMPSGELERLFKSRDVEEVSDKMREAQNSLRSGNMARASESTEVAAENLRSLQTEINDISESFRTQTADAMAERFEKVLRNTLFISKEQEQLRADTRDLPRNSPRLGQMAFRQQMLRDQLSQLISSLMTLSRETFAITPEMGKAIGRASVGMNESLTKLEERNGSESARKQGETVEALNEATVATLAAMEEIRQSGSASGFEQFLERMKQMAASQEGINAQTLQLALGQMASVSQEQLMRRLQRDQAQLKKSLEELMKEIRGSSEGGERLGGIGLEMEEVIKDFGRNNVNRRTIERQRRILTRMLDAQKSLRQQEMTEKRRAVTTGDIKRQGPAGLPADLGQRRNLAIEALNTAMKAGYPRDYREMIRRYFNSLVDLGNLSKEEKNENR